MAPALSTRVRSRKRRTNTQVWFWVDECKYSVVVDNVKGLGWKIVDEEQHEAKSNVYWIDVAAIHERFRSIQAWQTINHFPGMPNIARKNRMGQNLNRMLKIFPREYDFYPRTWILPGDYQFSVFHVITALRWRYLDRLRKQNTLKTTDLTPSYMNHFMHDIYDLRLSLIVISLLISLLDALSIVCCIPILCLLLTLPACPSHEVTGDATSLARCLFFKCTFLSQMTYPTIR